jgi:hypothetical protein
LNTPREDERIKQPKSEYSIKNRGGN